MENKDIFIKIVYHKYGTMWDRLKEEEELTSEASLLVRGYRKSIIKSYTQQINFNTMIEYIKKSDYEKIYKSKEKKEAIEDF